MTQKPPKIPVNQLSRPSPEVLEREVRQQQAKIVALRKMLAKGPGGPCFHIFRAA